MPPARDMRVPARWNADRRPWRTLAQLAVTLAVFCATSPVSTAKQLASPAPYLAEARSMLEQFFYDPTDTKLRWWVTGSLAVGLCSLALIFAGLYWNFRLRTAVAARTADLTARNEQLTREIAEHARAQDSLKESEERFRFLVEASPVMIWLTGGDRSCTDVSRAWTLFTGRTIEQERGTGWLDGVHPDDRPSFLDSFNLAFEHREPFRVECRFRRADGNYRWLLNVAVPRLDRAGQLLGFIGSCVDLTDRRRAEESLLASETRYRLLFETSPQASWIYDTRTLELRDVNLAALTLYGYTRREFLALRTLDLLELATTSDAPLPGAPTRQRHRTKLGALIDVELVIHEVSFIAADARLVVAREVTTLARSERERHLALEALRQSEERYRTLAESSSVGICQLSADGLTMFVNHAMSAMLEIDEPWEIIGKPFAEALAPASPPDAVRELAELLHEPHQPGECHIVGHRGTRRVLLVAAAPTYSAHGRVSSIIATFVDITEHRQTEANFRRLVETADEGIWQFDQSLITCLVNARMARLLDHTPDEMLGRHIFSFLDDQGQRLAAERLAHPSTDHSGPFELQLTRKDGSTIWASVAASLIIDDRGTHAGAFAMVTDITARKLAEEELRERSHELERSNRELERFAYVASHDLQEPLRMVTSFTQLLAQRYQGKLGRDADEFIAFAVEGATRMKQLIEDLLSYSRVSARRPNPVSVNAGSALDAALLNLRAAIEGSNAVITHDPLPTVIADPVQLPLVFQNLLANAIKFRKEPSPRIHVSATATGNECTISVRDSGIGIDPRHFDRLFVMFQRLNARGEYPGNGIGLAVCKMVVEQHRGRIWVESKPGDGATFRFTVPLSDRTEPS